MSQYQAPRIRFEGDAGSPFEGIWIEVRKVRSQAELRAITQNTYFVDLVEIMAPYIIAWNVTGTEEYTETAPESGNIPEREVIRFREVEMPPPAENTESLAVLTLFNQELFYWIRDRLVASIIHRTTDPKALNSPSASTPDNEQTGTMKTEPIQTERSAGNGSGKSVASKKKSRRTS